MLIFKYEKETIAYNFSQRMLLYSFLPFKQTSTICIFWPKNPFPWKTFWILRTPDLLRQSICPVPKEYYPRRLKSEKWTCKCSKSAHLRHIWIYFVFVGVSSVSATIDLHKMSVLSEHYTSSYSPCNKQ